MPLKAELARLLAQRCIEMGISFDRLAQIACVDREAIESLLNAEGATLELSIAERVANEVGLGLGVLGSRRSPPDGTSAVCIAAQSASTSYREDMPPSVLIDAIVAGAVDRHFRPHLRALLEEAPVGLLARLSYELEDQLDVPPAQTWKRMRDLACSLACFREIWR